IERIILNKKNYKIWSNLIMGELEDTSNDTNTERDGENTLNIRTVSEKDDFKAKRIIYKHLSEETWMKVEDIDTAYELWEYLKIYYCETDEEKARKY
ncbi:hypothetical protein H8356DRAFT_954724, partial [Neocallimastix lanati (nom. inval.)]